MLRYARSRGESFTCSCAVVARRVPDPFAAMIEATGDRKAIFNPLIGRLHLHRAARWRVVASSDDERAHYERDPTLSRIGEPIEIGPGAKLWVFESKEEERDPDYPLIAAYIHGYQKLTLHHDVLARVPFADVMRVWVDGVSFREPLPSGFFESIGAAARWHPAERKTLDESHASVPLPIYAPIVGGTPDGGAPTAPGCIAPAYEPLRLLPRVALLGPPGCGKSWRARNFWGADGRRVVLTGSTNMAALNLGGDSMTAEALLAMVTGRPLQGFALLRGIDRLVVDEFPMLGRPVLEKLEALGLPLLLCGDFEQLGNWTEPTDRAWLEAHGYHIEDITENHRAGDAATLALYAEVRGKSTRGIVDACRAAGVQLVPRGHQQPECDNFQPAALDLIPFPSLGTRAHYIASCNDEVDAVNRAYAAAVAGPASVAMVWGGTGHHAARYTAPATVGMLVIGITTLRGAGRPRYRNQEVGTLAGWTFRKKRGTVDLEGVASVRSSAAPEAEPVDVPFSCLVPGFAITFHRCQGQTFDFATFVSLRRVSDRRMLYVAVTRIRRIDQLRLVGCADEVQWLSKSTALPVRPAPEEAPPPVDEPEESDEPEKECAAAPLDDEPDPYHGAEYPGQDDC